MTNRRRKVRQGVDFFYKRILDSFKFDHKQCFRIQPCLQQSFPRSQQSISQYHSAWSTTYQDSFFYVSIFLVSGKREGEEKHREPPPSLHYYFLFFQVWCSSIFFPTQLFSCKKMEIAV